jgi:hypothetical protein
MEAEFKSSANMRVGVLSAPPSMILFSNKSWLVYYSGKDFMRCLID